MLINLQSAPEPDAKLPASSVPAPRVRVRHIESGQVVEPVLNEGSDSDDFHAAFLAAFATTSSTVAEALFGQLLNGRIRISFRQAGDPVRKRIGLGFRRTLLATGGKAGKQSAKPESLP